MDENLRGHLLMGLHLTPFPIEKAAEELTRSCGRFVHHSILKHRVQWKLSDPFLL